MNFTGLKVKHEIRPEPTLCGGRSQPEAIGWKADGAGAGDADHRLKRLGKGGSRVGIIRAARYLPR